MREIKYRGKRIDNGEWVYGYYLQEYNNLSFEYFIFDYKKYHDVIPESIGQWTNLTDKNKTEIYHKDIYKFPSGHIAIIEWNNGGFGYYSHGDFIGFSNHNWLENILKGEVIGNIFDNPELLAAE